MPVRKGYLKHKQMKKEIYIKLANKVYNESQELSDKNEKVLPRFYNRNSIKVNREILYEMAKMDNKNKY